MHHTRRDGLDLRSVICSTLQEMDLINLVLMHHYQMDGFDLFITICTPLYEIDLIFLVLYAPLFIGLS
jgi:hypothetical protein